jgi:hypothetical protein
MSRTERLMVAKVVREIRAIQRMISGKPDNRKVKRWVSQMEATSLTRKHAVA